ncbi:MAG: hydrogenase expression/formation protein HypE [Butyrivibrio sp.]|jgi:hydrogenase expression/formation protein HypE|nr:hydrogenase expression/formation protein HypE [Butyrivibrio sp.]
MIITMAHGSGGAATSELIDEIFVKAFDNKVLTEMEDSAVVEGSGRIAMTTDSFVVTPIEFPGGDIGRLCVCGTVNDLLMRGATPKYLTCGFIIQEGADTQVLQKIVKSMADTAKEAGVNIVAGDTKVVEGNGQIVINTAGVGFVPEGINISAKNITAGDVIIVSGNLGDHHAAILGSRLAIDNKIESDNAPLGEMVKGLLEADIPVHTLRDVTRGGLATVLKELSESSRVRIELEEDALPVSNQVRDFCGLLGLDPLYMGNEGKMIAAVPAEYADKAVEIIRSSRYGEKATVIGQVLETENTKGELYLKTAIGGLRALDVLQGEGLPRIC